MISRRWRLLILPLFSLLLAAACGDDPQASGAGGAPDAPASSLPQAADAGTGRGQLSVEDGDYMFDAELCALHPVQHQGREYDLYIAGSGELGGQVHEVEVFRTVSASGNAVETLRMTDADGAVIAGTNIYGEGSGSQQLAVSSSLLNGELALTGTDEVDAGIGVVSITCN